MQTISHERQTPGRQFAGLKLSWYGFINNRCLCISVFGLFPLQPPKLQNAACLDEQPMSLKTADPLNKFIVTA
jgi:hypothetical protein